jgi:tetratricopeptide (TPR) repeat protein
MAGANTDLTEALPNIPETAIAYYYRGTARSALGDYQGVVEDFTQVLRLEPNSPSAYYNRAVAYAALGDRERAVADLEQALAQYTAQGDAQGAQRTEQALQVLRG